MFENIIQQEAVKHIINDIQSKKVPQSILFSGPANSAKLTTAMEFARVLSCTKNADWICDCPSCTAMRAIKSVDLLIIGQRDLSLEIKAAAKCFLKMKSTGSSFLFTRAVKKLLLRFDSRLWDSDESRFIKASPFLADVQELLGNTLLFLENDKEDKLIKNVEKIINLTEKIQDAMYETIPVNQVRKASAWIRLSPFAKYKFLIIENAERIQESARAAFLKILEEPPNYAFFILTTTRPSAIMKTILSRVRKYNFLPRSNKDEIEIIRRVFHDEPLDHNSENILDRYFLNFLPVPFEKIKEAAQDFWLSVFINYSKTNKLQSVRKFIIKDKINEAKSIKEILKGIDAEKNLAVFKILLEEITGIFAIILTSNMSLPAIEVEDFYTAKNIILKWKNANTVYNISVQATLESIAMEIGEL